MIDRDEELTDILITDDQEANLLSLEGLLEAPHLNLIRARSGEEALEVVMRSRPALILLDVQMPGMDGFELARLLRGSPRTREIPIIFVTATHREDRFTFQGFESGAVDYLFKPLNAVVVRSKVAVFVDLHRSRMRLERALDEVMAVNHELDSFAHSVAHELHSPARAVVGFGGALLEECRERLSPAERDDLGRVVAAGERMQNLVDGLLSLSQTSRQELKRQEVDLTALARRIDEELRHENPERKVRFEAEEGMLAQGDPQLLYTVLRNLLANAWKYSSGSGGAQVTFRSSALDGERVFCVRDNGAGFDPSQKDRLFGAFQRLHTQSEFAGNGIGLATVQRIVHRHGGRIWAESAVGEGASFHFVLGR